MKKTTFLIVVLFLFFSGTVLKAECPYEIRRIGNTVYLFFEQFVPEGTPPATFTFPNGTTFTLPVAVVATWPNALPYLIPDEYQGLDFSGELEIWIGEEGPCYYNNGQLDNCDLSLVCEGEIITIVEEAIDACKFWDGDCGIDSPIQRTGKVGLGVSGTINLPDDVGGANISNYRLYVEGGILAEEVRVRSDWADYVFDYNYMLMPLLDVEKFIATHGHLHNVPSAEQVEEQGFEVGDMTKIQQEKMKS